MLLFSGCEKVGGIAGTWEGTMSGGQSFAMSITGEIPNIGGTFTFPDGTQGQVTYDADGAGFGEFKLRIGWSGQPGEFSLPASFHWGNVYVNFDETRNRVFGPMFVWWAGSTGTQGRTYRYTATRR